MSLCPRCKARWEPDPQNRPVKSDSCEMCNVSMKEEERKSGTQLKMSFMTRSPVSPKFPHLLIKSSGLIVKKKSQYDSALAKPQPSSNGGDNEKKLAVVYTDFIDKFDLYNFSADF
jgi:hypothetical protein